MVIQSKNSIFEKFQRQEKEDYLIYRYFSKIDKKNKEVFERLSKDELKHYNILKEITKKDVRSDYLKVFFYIFLSYIFGKIFVVKLLERREEKTLENYKKYSKEYKEFLEILKDEENHEKILLKMIRDSFVNYLSSIILGLNDALIELTGALIGISSATNNTFLTGIAGIITGISASLSMASSEYLSKRSEREEKPLKAAFFTGLAYIIVVLILTLPFFIYKSVSFAIINTLINALLIIITFSYVYSVIEDKDFKKEFLTMLIASFGVAGISYLIGNIINLWLLT